MIRFIFRGWLVLLGSVLVAGCPKPAPQPAAPAPGRPATGARAGGPRAPAARRAASRRPPGGPSLSGRLVGSLQVGPIHRLEGRIGALVKALMAAAPFGRSSRIRLLHEQILPGVCKALGLTPLALESLDEARSLVVGMVRMPGAPAKIGSLRFVALVPYKGRGDIVLEAVTASVSNARRAPWGGVVVHEGTQDELWVWPHAGYVVVAPSAALVRSAEALLRPLARHVPEGTARLMVHADRLLPLLAPQISREWASLRRASIRLGVVRMGLLEGLVATNLDLVQQWGSLLGSLQGLEATLRIGDAGWDLRVAVTPAPGGPLASWLAAQRAPDPKLGRLLPPGSGVAITAWLGETLGRLPQRLLRSADKLLLPRLEQMLPHAVAVRGLLRRRRPVPYLTYRRRLRDLNLKDYRASYALYRTVFAVRDLAAHAERWGGRLVAAETGEAASGFYFGKGGRLGFALVKGLRSVQAHRHAMNALMMGYQRYWMRLLKAAYGLVPRPMRKRYALGRLPVRVVFNPVALQVRGVRVSSLAIRLRWPRVPAGTSLSALADLELVRKAVQALAGKGPLTYAWAYARGRFLGAGGAGWQARMRALIRASQLGPRAVPAGNASRLLPAPAEGASPGAVRLLDSAFSLGRLLLWGMDLVGILRGGSAGPGLLQPLLARLRAQVASSAGAASSAMRLTASRRRGQLLAKLWVPRDALLDWMRMGMFLFVQAGTAPRRAGAGKLPHSKPPASPSPAP